MNAWEKTYKQGFKINSYKPSEVIKFIPSEKNKNSFILDLGCGNGRNSLYFSKNENEIDCIDVVDSITEKIKNLRNIHFYKKDIRKINYPINKYDIVLMVRLIQYISKRDLKNLIRKIGKSMKKRGLLVITYTFSGGIFNQKYPLKLWRHRLSNLINLLEKNNFEIVFVRNGGKETSHVPYKEKVKIYELIARKNVQPKSF